MLEQLAVERAAGPVDGRPVAREEPVPIDGLAAGGGIPRPRVVHPLEHLDHMIAFGESQFFERDLEREGPRAAETGADDLDGHLLPPQSGTVRQIDELVYAPRGTEPPSKLPERAIVGRAASTGKGWGTATWGPISAKSPCGVRELAPAFFEIPLIAASALVFGASEFCRGFVRDLWGDPRRPVDIPCEMTEARHHRQSGISVIPASGMWISDRWPPSRSITTTWTGDGSSRRIPSEHRPG